MAAERKALAATAIAFAALVRPASGFQMPVAVSWTLLGFAALIFISDILPPAKTKWLLPWSLVPLGEAASFCDRHLDGLVQAAADVSDEMDGGGHEFFENFLVTTVQIYAHRTPEAALRPIRHRNTTQLWSVGDGKIKDGLFGPEKYSDAHVRTGSVLWLVAKRRWYYPLTQLIQRYR